MAAGLTLVLGVMGVINLAHGSYYLLGGYVGFSIAKHTGSFFLGLLGGTTVAGVLGVFTYRILLSRRFAESELAQVLITFGLLLVFADIFLWIWGGVPLSIPKPDILRGGVHVAGMTYPLFRLFIIPAGAAVFLFLWWFQERTKYGAVVRAGVDDEQMTQAIGINISVVKTLVFGLGALLAGFAGAAGGPFVGLYPGLDVGILVLALVVVIIGGKGSLWGALIGALCIGLLDSFGNSLLPEFSLFTIFGAMVFVLAVKPSGILGRE